MKKKVLEALGLPLTTSQSEVTNFMITWQLDEDTRNEELTTKALWNLKGTAFWTHVYDLID